MNRRNSTEIWVWLRREWMRLVDVQRELGFRSHKTVWATIEGRENNRRVLSWLHAHYDRPLRLAKLREIAHLTASQLQRVFKRSTRMSISQYVTQLRIGRACQLLVQTDRPLAHIAVECGFSDAAHFSRQFRAARGMPPSRFRNSFADTGV